VIAKQRLYLRWLSRALRPFAHVYYKMRYRVYPNPFSPIEIDLFEITGWYRGDIYSEISFAGQIKRGDWRSRVTNRKDYLAYNLKYRAVEQRYVEGLSWKDTVLFQEYASYQPHKPLPKGARDLDELESIYEKRYDSLFKVLKEKGFRPAGQGVRPVYVCIDRGGEIYYTVDGNHRLAMAMVLGIQKIPVQVLRRHKDWQIRRDRICENLRLGQMLDPEDGPLSHSDLRDLKGRCGDRKGKKTAHDSGCGR